MKSPLDSFKMNYEPINSKEERKWDLHRQHYRDNLKAERFFVGCILASIG